ncbi:hypothetical protein UFOVP1138_62 [uncultured Caudovirales phage]|uniref:Peptidase M28 n=1 Tax=uncultured Caudovirales phage TaxID=2100421 RepID=A0A6J5PWP6_9CAUD|nr:hypothetical protein UFOVP975_58 [uncultured Caudovirales phage]CAB4186293.1 hypothetical protein UFOVP1138_62 [uncultured Caudovirales phage]CAB4204439.1 hypothetical protein UFOVP1394_59 [uncultured Caudovirales phage]
MDIAGILSLEDKEVFEVFRLEAKSRGRKIFSDNENYMFIKGSDRICLVAHIDTVSGEWVDGTRKPVKKKLVEKYGIIRAYTERGKRPTILGADDRAGCYGLLDIMKSDDRPSILLTNYEECGGVGVGVFTNETDLWKNTDFFVELDRAGCNEYVQYNENTQEVHDFMAKFAISNGGYGSYSDIATISKVTKIPSVNLAIGYRSQHSDREYLDLAVMSMAIKKAKLIIHRYCKDKPQLGRIKERPIPPTRSSVYDWNSRQRKVDSEEIKCAECGAADGHHYRSCPDYDNKTGNLFNWEEK